MKNKLTDLWRETEKFWASLEDAKLRLAFLKENFDFRDELEELKKNEKLPDEKFCEKFRMNPALFRFPFPKEFFLKLLDRNWTGEKEAFEPKFQKYVSDSIRYLFYMPRVCQIGTGRSFEHIRWEVTENINLHDLPSHYRILRIDCRGNREEIKAEFSLFLDLIEAWRKKLQGKRSFEWRGFEDWDFDDSRKRKQASRQLAIWKMRDEKIPFKDITKQLNISSLDLTKKHFYRAYELSQWRKYEPEKYKDWKGRILIGEFENPCPICPKYEICTDLCPKAMKYADQDHVKRKEALFYDSQRDIEQE